MAFDFSFYIGQFKKNLIKNAGQGNCGIFLLLPLSKLAFVDVSDTKISRWVNNKFPIDESLRSFAGTEAGYNATYNHFKNEVIKDINNNMIERIVLNILDAIKKDSSIDQSKRLFFEKSYSSGDLADFLTRSFLYVVSIQTEGSALTLDSKSICKPNDGNNTLLLRKISDLIEAELSTNIGLPDNEIELISSNNFNLILAAKENRHAFTVFVEVKADGISTEYTTFADYMNWLRFSGKGIQVELRRICVFDYLGRKIIEETDPIYMGRSLPVPPIRIKEYNREMKDLLRCKLYIKPPQDILELELTDLYGNCLFGFSQFRVEREKKDNLLIANFICVENEDIILKFIFICNDENDKSKLHFSIKADRKDVNSSKCNAAYYQLISKIYESGEMIIWQRKDGKRCEFVRVPAFREKYEKELDYYRQLREIYQKIIYIENTFNLLFNVSEFTPDNISWVNQLHELLIKGKVSLSIEEYTLTSDYYDSYKDKINDLQGEGVLFNGYISDIGLFDKQIDITQKYKLAIWASQVIKNDDNSLTLKVRKSILYDIMNDNVNEEEILKIKTSEQN